MRSDDPRLTRLRALIGKLERLPASAQRERALSEARARVVDVETGEIPRVMRPVDEPAQGSEERPPVDERRPEPEPKPKRTRTAARRERAQVLRRPPVEPVPPAPPTAPAAGEETALGSDGLLWLEDPADDPGTRGKDDDRTPWRRGLRG